MRLKMSLWPAKKDLLSLCLTVGTLASLGSALYFSEDGFLQDEDSDFPFGIPPFANKLRNVNNAYHHPQPYTPAYPTNPEPPVKATFDVEVMRPIEAMPGKKTVNLYVVPQNQLNLHISGSRSRAKRDNTLQLRFQGFVPPAKYKYPEYLGYTDGYHIPAVEIPLRKPLTVRDVELKVSAPAGFMVPYWGQGAYHAMPLHVGALIAPASSAPPFTISKMYAVPHWPESGYGRPVEQHNHIHVHAEQDSDLEDAILRLLPTPEPVYGVFEITVPKDKKKKKKKKKDSDEEEDDDSTTTTTTTTTTEATTTTTTTTEAAASSNSIQDIIASLSSNNRFDQERVSGSRGGSSSSSLSGSLNSNPFRNYQKTSDLQSRETSYLQNLRQQTLRRQLDQLQKLLSSLNLSGPDRSLEQK